MISTSEAYVVMRVFTMRTGDIHTIPLEAYSTKGEAQRDADNWNRTGGQLLTCRLIAMGEDGNVDAGLNVNEFLMSLGIVDIQHKMMRRGVHARFVDPDEVSMEVKGHA